MEKLKKLFGGIDLSWKKIIIFAIIAGVYTAIMAILPIAKDTSFADITISFEVWILFGIIIIMNSKSAKDSALKCFLFFLISQPLVYLIQVPFASGLVENYNIAVLIKNGYFQFRIWVGAGLFGFTKLYFLPCTDCHCHPDGIAVKSYAAAMFQLCQQSARNTSSAKHIFKCQTVFLLGDGQRSH